MRKTKMALAVAFGVACYVVAFSIPPGVEGGFFIGYVLGFVGATVAVVTVDWQLFKMKLERRRSYK